MHAAARMMIAASIAAAAMTAAAHSAPRAERLATQRGTPPRAQAVRLGYLGTAGWQIGDGRTTLLIDPYLSRLRMTTPNDDVRPGDTRRQFALTDAAESDAATIDAHIQRADFILLTHTHPDHALDVPYIASKTGATVIGTESARNLARAYGIAADKLIVARGGDDLAFDGWSVRVIPSLHGILRRAPFLRRDPNAPPPATIPIDAVASTHGAADALGPVQRHVRRESGARDRTAAIVHRRGQSRVTGVGCDRAKYFERIDIR